MSISSQNTAHLKALEKKVQALFLSGKLHKIVGVEAKNHFQEAFQHEGFADDSDYPGTDVQWTEVKRRQKPKSKKRSVASEKRKILTGETGDLGDSFYYDYDSGTVTIKNPVEYAQIQNEGGKAGKNGSATIPARKFMGESKVLIKKIIKKFHKEFDQVLK
jgi:phage gpG-like protein